MYKHFFFAIYYVFIHAVNLQSQIQLFATGGINYSNVNTILILDITPHLQDHYFYTTFYNFGVGICYPLKKVNLYTGLRSSSRGSKTDYLTPPFATYIYDIYDFLEMPLIITRSFFRKKLELGGGIVNSLRLYTNSYTRGNEHEYYGLDLKGVIKYNLLRRFSLEGSYLFGNFDKLIFNKKGNYLYSVFAINIDYSFYISKKSQ